MFLIPDNVPDVHVGEHDQEVAEPGGRRAGQHVHRHHVAQDTCHHRKFLVLSSAAYGFHNHGEGPYYGLLLVESVYYRFYI